MPSQYRDDFILAEASSYLINHSVGRPLKSSQQHFQDIFFAPWQRGDGAVWQDWLEAIETFRQALGRLFHSPTENFCPQVNLSSALSKIVMSLSILQEDDGVVLMSEIDFPSIGFALEKALPQGRKQLRFLPKHLDVTDIANWQQHIDALHASDSNVAMLFVSHAYSNTGQQAPLMDILALAQKHKILSVVDVAQSAGIMPLDLSLDALPDAEILMPDFVIGSSVKWLCGGSGAGYLWVNPEILPLCEPKDVGWFSHPAPFEFDIHNFRYHQGAARFWGGTPAVAPFVLAAHSINYMAKHGVPALRTHNQALLEPIIVHYADFLQSPQSEKQRNGTAVLHFADKQEQILHALREAKIYVDTRALGMRISPHIYNDESDIARLIKVIDRYL